MLSFTFWLLVGCGIGVFLFYICSVILQIIGSIFELLFDEDYGLVTLGIIAIIALVVFLLYI